MRSTLNEVCDKQSSGIMQKDVKPESGPYPIYGASGLIGKVDFYQQEKPYIAVVKDGAGVGRTFLLPGKSSIIGTMQYLIPKENVLPEYLFYVVKHMHLEKYYTGATIPHIYFKDYKDESFNLETIDNQKKIVSVLAKIELINHQRQEEIIDLDTLIKSRFVEMFGDPATPGLKFNSDKLSNVAKVKSSHRIFTNEFVKIGVPFYRGTEIGELAEGKIPSNPFYISKERYLQVSNDDSKPLVGDLLMPSICNKGQVWMVDTEDPFYYKDGRVLCISPNRNIYNPKYLQYYMKYRTEIDYPKLGSGSTFAEFKIFQLKNLIIDIPPIEYQNKFVLFVEQVDKSKSSAIHRYCKLIYNLDKQRIHIP